MMMTMMMIVNQRKLSQVLCICWILTKYLTIGWNSWTPSTLRQNFLSKGALIIGASNLLLNNPLPSLGIEQTTPPSTIQAAQSSDRVTRSNQNYYFGLGCFWHVQHEFVEKEKTLLQRSDDQITSVVGYAGGTKRQKDGLVCYHNIEGVEDYSRLGHAEVVTVDFPKENFKDFVELYLSLFSSSLDRPDIGDRGAEYRSLIGLPGGIQNDQFPILKELAESKGLKLKEGKGNDDDTLGKRTVWIMDSNRFSFNQGEIYHQFHDGFMPGEQYPPSYNQLVRTAFARGLLHQTGCPAKFKL